MALTDLKFGDLEAYNTNETLKVCLDRTYFAETENLLLKLL